MGETAGVDDAHGFPAGFFDRADPGADAAFYAPPRLVTHIDDAAIAAVGDLYAELGITGTVLDLMGSWVSHFREPPAHLTVLGMNAAELAANPAATATVVHDLNAEPAPAVRRRVVRRRGLLRVRRLPDPAGRGVRRRRAHAAPARALRHDVLEPLLPHQGDPGLARVIRRAALRDRRPLLPARGGFDRARRSNAARRPTTAVIRCSRSGPAERLPTSRDVPGVSRRCDAAARPA